MPDGLRPLEAEAVADGVHNVTRLLDRWVDGSERYEAPGESLLVALAAGTERVVGVGGISRCPDVAGALRVRRFYVAADWRRDGVARLIAETLIEDARRNAELVTCNAGASAAAVPFWESMGFSRSEAAGVTHELKLSITGPGAAATA